MAITKTVKVDAKLLEGYRIEMHAGPFTAYVDQPEAMGGKNSAPTPLDYQFFSLASCLVTIAKIAAMQKGIKLRGVSCAVEGGLNTAVLMGKDTGERAGFQTIKAVLDIDADMTLEEKEAFVEEVDARCPISDNLTNTSNVEIVLKK